MACYMNGQYAAKYSQAWQNLAPEDIAAKIDRILRSSLARMLEIKKRGVKNYTVQDAGFVVDMNERVTDALTAIEELVPDASTVPQHLITGIRSLADQFYASVSDVASWVPHERAVTDISRSGFGAQKGYTTATGSPVNIGTIAAAAAAAAIAFFALKG